MTMVVTMGLLAACAPGTALYGGQSDKEQHVNAKAATTISEPFYTGGPSEKIHAFPNHGMLVYGGGRHSKDLHVLNLDTGSDRVIASTSWPLGQVDGEVADGEWIAWVDFVQVGRNNGQWALNAYNVDSKKVVHIASTQQGRETAPNNGVGIPSIPVPALSDGVVAWVERSHGARDVHIYKLRTHSESVITENASAVSVALDYPYIAYVEHVLPSVSSSFRVVVENLRTGAIRQYKVDGYPNYLTAGGAGIAWVREGRDGVETLFYLDPAAAKVTQIGAPGSATQALIPAVGRDFVAWMTAGRSNDMFSYVVLPALHGVRHFRVVGGQPIRSPQAHGSDLVWLGSQRDKQGVAVRDWIYAVRVSSGSVQSLPGW